MTGRYANADIIISSINSTPTYHEGTDYDRIIFGNPEYSIPFVRNSILLIPCLLSPTECAALVQDCETEHRKQFPNVDDSIPKDEGMERYMLCELSQQTQDFFENIILRERLLPFIKQKFPPIIEQHIWEVSMIPNEDNNLDLLSQTFKFSSQEPAINRYATAGYFEPHRDKLALTLNILLSDQFEGGGTQFWEEMSNGKGRDDEYVNPSLCVLPSVGTGVIFNGTVKHAGRKVLNGRRHLLVASFSVARSKTTTW